MFEVELVQKGIWNSDSLCKHEVARVGERINSWSTFRFKVIPYRPQTWKEHNDSTHLMQNIKRFGSSTRVAEEGMEHNISLVKKQDRYSCKTNNVSERVGNTLGRCAGYAKPGKKIFHNKSKKCPDCGRYKSNRFSEAQRCMCGDHVF